MKLRQFFVLVALVASLLLVACTTERDPVDKSPEMSLDKSLFEGEFFYRQTIVDLPYTADYAFIGESNDGKILAWKITKNWLIAYDIHDNLEVVNTSEEPTVNETPLLAYRIMSHYDILPMENPVTGEDLPVYTANYDCNWNECRFFQIDPTYAGTPNFELKWMALSEYVWGAPYRRGAVTSATDFEFYSHDGSYIPAKFYSYMLKKAGEESKEKEVELFTFRTQEQLIPSSWTNFYTMADVNEFFKNEPANIWYRHTFTKVNRDVYGRRTYDPKTKTWPWKRGSIDNGFRPLIFNDELFRMFGYFTNKFKGYNPDHGYKDDSVYEMANYFNIAWGRLKKDASFDDNGITDGNNIEWNFVCDSSADKVTVADYNKCLADVVVQQKIVFTSSGETPKRMIAPNCAMAKDYNHAMLAARFAAMNPGSDVRDFEAWYVATYENDFFVTIKSGGNDIEIRDIGWYTHTDDFPNWEAKCFVVGHDVAHVQKWNGDIIEDKYTNEVATLIQNPVEAFIAKRDGSHLSDYINYGDYDESSANGGSDVNAIRVCVPTADAEGADEYEKLQHFAHCLTNDTQMTKLYTEDYGREKWKGDRWDCRALADDETCEDVAKEAVGPQADVDAWTEVRAACVLDEERNCKTYGTDVIRPMLRHKYMNGDMSVAMWNWVDQPTEYGILGVSQWNINPETGQSFGAGSNVAGSVLQWAISRAVEMSRMLIDDNDPAAWDWENLVNPGYDELPSKIWDNSPDKARTPKSPMATRSIVERPEKEPLNIRPGVNMEALSQMPKMQNRFDYSSVKGTKWEGKMISWSLLKSLFPWSDPTEYDYSDDMKDTLSSLYNPERTAVEMDRMIARSKNTYFEASFLDGAIIQFLQERQALYKEKYPKWKTSEADEYKAAFLTAVSDDLEILMYKGVAEHEMGHSLGLRHNFISSADMFNYQDGYFSSDNYPNLMNEEAKLVAKLTAEEVDPGVIGDEVYKLKRAYPYSPDKAATGEFVRLPGTNKETMPISYNMYVSIMDYQSEPYIHAIGLGKYDSAALKFVYGRSIEQMSFDSDGFVEMHADNPIRDARYPQPIMKNLAYVKESTGKMKTVGDFRDPRIASDDAKKNRLRASKLVRYYDEMGELKWRLVLDVEDGYYGGMDLDPASGVYTLKRPDRYVINDGSIYPYLFFSDETRTSEPASNVWDTGYLATDIIRSFRYNADKYYFLRFFRRGNPRFREFRGRNFVKMILGAYYSTYKYVHFLLDLNYNIVQRGWLWKMAIENDTQYALRDDGTATFGVKNMFYHDYTRAMAGEEYWLADVKDKDGAPVQQFRELMPMEGGDYLLAGALGVDYFLDDVVYRPDSSTFYMKKYRKHPTDERSDENPYLLSDKLEVSQDGYWVRNGYITGGLEEKYKLDVPYSMGRVQKDHWDKQDDPTIYYDHVTIRGFAEEKMVALYTLGNSGWVSDKYRRESMANSIGAYSTGFENTIFNMLSEVANEDVLFGLSPYCVYREKMIRVSLPLQLKMNFFGAPPILDGDPKELPTNLCAYYGMATAEGLEEVDSTGTIAEQQATVKANMLKKVQNAARYEPVQAGWTYFDKTWPLYWGMGSISNISADTTILWKFVTMTYTTAERGLYPAIDVDEVEVLNSLGNRFYRAKLPLNDLTDADRVALAQWKEVLAAGGTEDEALCEHRFDANDVDLGCLHYCLDGSGDRIPVADPTIDEYGFVESETSLSCATPGAIKPQDAGLEAMLNKYLFYYENGYADNIPAEIGTTITAANLVPNKQTYTFYVRAKYARFSPAFKLVWSLERNNTQGDGTISADPAAQKTTIMETTLDSMNAWAKDNLETSVIMAFY